MEGLVDCHQQRAWPGVRPLHPPDVCRHEAPVVLDQMRRRDARRDRHHGPSNVVDEQREGGDEGKGVGRDPRCQARGA